MRSLMCLALVGSWLIAAVSLAADAPAAGTTPQAAADETPKPAAAPAGGDAWRFKRHNDVWWYWLPTEKWVYWTGDKWVPYDQKTYGQFYAARHPQVSPYAGRAFNYQGQGNWGPVRYNQYGQPQYPYSQRTSGIRQLGPVPAMGGVRSLPGWGGER